jgi:hypothetical protein
LALRHSFPSTKHITGRGRLLHTKLLGAPHHNASSFRTSSNTPDSKKERTSIYSLLDQNNESTPSF